MIRTQTRIPRGPKNSHTNTRMDVDKLEDRILVWPQERANASHLLRHAAAAPSTPQHIKTQLAAHAYVCEFACGSSSKSTAFSWSNNDSVCNFLLQRMPQSRLIRAKHRNDKRRTRAPSALLLVIAQTTRSRGDLSTISSGRNRLLDLRFLGRFVSNY